MSEADGVRDPASSASGAGSGGALPVPELLQVEAGPRIGGKRVRYPEPLSVYAVRLGKDERTLKRYVALGRASEPIDLPPLHRPRDLPAWWEKHMTERVPEWVLSAAAKDQDKPVPQPAVSAPTAAPGIRDWSSVQSMGLEENVEALRQNLAICHRLLQDAQSQNPPDMALITSRQRNYRETFSELRKAEVDLSEWLSSQGRTVPRDEVRAENNRISSAIFNAVVRLVKNVRPQLEGKAPTEQDQIWEREVRGCFTSLKAAKFADPIPEVAPC